MYKMTEQMIAELDEILFPTEERIMLAEILMIRSMHDGEWKWLTDFCYRNGMNIDDLIHKAASMQVLLWGRIPSYSDLGA